MKKHIRQTVTYICEPEVSLNNRSRCSALCRASVDEFPRQRGDRRSAVTGDKATSITELD